MTSQECAFSLVDVVILWAHTHTHLTQEFTESQDKRMQLLFLSHFLPLALSHQFCVFPSSLQQILRRQPQITAYTHTHTLTRTRQHFWKLATSTFTLYHRYETPAVLTSCTDGSTASILVVLFQGRFHLDDAIQCQKVGSFLLFFS